MLTLKYPDKLLIPECSRNGVLCDVCCSAYIPEIYIYDILKCRINPENIDLENIHLETNDEMTLKRESGKCVYNKDKGCSIHENKPLACSNYPFYLKGSNDYYQVQSQSLSQCRPLREVSMQELTEKYPSNNLVAYKACELFNESTFEIINDSLGSKGLLDIMKRIGIEREIFFKTGFNNLINKIISADFLINDKEIFFDFSLQESIENIQKKIKPKTI